LQPNSAVGIAQTLGRTSCKVLGLWLAVLMAPSHRLCQDRGFDGIVITFRARRPHFLTSNRSETSHQTYKVARQLQEFISSKYFICLHVLPSDSQRVAGRP
jgi:hypothetical protein